MATGEKRAARRLTAAVTAFLMMLMMAAVLLPGMRVNAEDNIDVIMYTIPSKGDSF